MLEIVSTQDLRLGMFVVELDRPWLGTPFPLQGFLIGSDRQLDALREYCRFVSVDRSLSVAGEFRADRDSPHPGRGVPEFPRALGAALGAERTNARPKLPRPSMEPMAPATGALPADDHSRLLGLMSRPASRLAGLPERIAYADTASVEAELPASNEAYVRTQEFMRDLSSQIARESIPELDRIRETVDGLVQSVVRNPDALIWLSRLKRSDNYSYDHALDVSVHLMAFGRHLGLPLEELNTLGVAGLMQDIGKTRIPLQLLQKQGPLSSAERAVLRRHVEFSVQILKEQKGVTRELLDIIAKHHERINGQGYPRRLTGEDIGTYAEMAGLVDSYCAMCYERPYRQALDNQHVLHKLYTSRGKAFSEPVVIELIQCVGLYPVGTLVELSSREVGVVIEQNRVRRLQPRVMLLLAPDKTPRADGEIVDLTRAPTGGKGAPYRILRALPPGSYGIDPQEFYL